MRYTRPIWVKLGFWRKTGRSRAVYESIQKTPTGKTKQISVASSPSVPFFPWVAPKGPFWPFFFYGPGGYGAYPKTPIWPPRKNCWWKWVQPNQTAEVSRETGKGAHPRPPGPEAAKRRNSRFLGPFLAIWPPFLQICGPILGRILLCAKNRHVGCP